jgi:HAD superfamily hydrolase (TIGR01509 family)
MIQAVIFDVGGILIYSNDDHFETANAWCAANFLRSQGFEFDAAEFAKQLLDLRAVSPKGDANFRQINTTPEHLQRVATKVGLEPSSELLSRLELAFVTPEVYGAVALPGIHEVVKSLVGKVRLGVISNTRSHILIEETVKHLGLRECFETFVTSVSAGHRKPSPHIFRAVLDVWELPSEQVVMIGDSPSKDVVGAKAIGMKTIWLTTDAGETEAFKTDTIAKTLAGILETW